MDLLAWFLPVSLPPERTHLGYKLWLTEVMDMWATCNNIPSWEPVGILPSPSSFSLTILLKKLLLLQPSYGYFPSKEAFTCLD